MRLSAKIKLALLEERNTQHKTSPTEEKTLSLLTLDGSKTPVLFAGTLLGQHFREKEGSN